MSASERQQEKESHTRVRYNLYLQNKGAKQLRQKSRHSIVNESMHVATDTSDIEERQVSDYVVCKLQTVG